ncbi:MAG: hypothetical protein V9G24_13010 [Rhodoblastus sp.]
MILPRADEFRALHDVEADAAAADDDDARARFHLRRAIDGADAGRHRAADDGGDRPRQVLADRHEVFERADDLFAERADARHLVDGLGLELQARRAVGHEEARRRMAVAEHRLAGIAVAAMAAMRGEGEDDMVADRDMRGAGTDFGDDSRRLVARHERQLGRPVAVHHVPVGHAHAGRLHLHARLAGLRRVEFEIEKFERLVDLGEDGGLHHCLPFWSDN